MLTTIAHAIGKGLFAGLAGTAVMTVSSTLEMKLRGREGSDAPAQAAFKVLGVEPVDDDARQRVATLVHWGYGTGWGIARGLLDVAGVRGAPASALHFAAVWGAALVMLPRLEIAPPATEWGAKQLAMDAWHHAVYAGATGFAYDRLDAGTRVRAIRCG